MKPNATLWVIGSYHNIFRVGAILQDLGFWILNDIVWRKSNPMPNFRGRRFTNAHETLIWAARDAAEARLYVQLRGAQGGQRRHPDALRLVHSAVHRRGAAQGPRRQEAASDAKAGSPAGPRHLSASRPDDVVLDPFCGTGTTGAVARRLRRRFIGVEREADYAAAAGQRIDAVEPIAEPALASFMTAREAPRVPFTALIERGLVSPGIRLVDAKRRHRALVRADGALALGEAVGSIHRIGALAQGLEACNGWTFWHVETPDGLTVIDDYRAIVRSEMAQAAD